MFDLDALAKIDAALAAIAAAKPKEDRAGAAK
jgi:hypothetical protein